MLPFINRERRRQPGQLDEAAARLATCRTEDDVVEALRSHARAVAGADGITVVRRDGDEVVYVGEDAIAPLWTGQRFPIRMCVSGMAILDRAPIVIPDILNDRRVPLNAYLSTFVRSMAMFPIGRGAPAMAMGAYWRDARPITPLAIERLGALAQAGGDALDRIGGGERAVA